MTGGWQRETRTPHKGCGEQEPHTKDVGKNNSHCENTLHEEGRGGGGGGGGEGEELAVRKKNKNPTQRMWGKNQRFLIIVTTGVC